MSKLTFIALAVGLIWTVTATDGLAQVPAQAPAPNFSSADFPWMPTSDGFLPPPTGFGPITYDQANPRIVPTLNLFGDVSQKPLRLADSNNPNLKAWVIDELRKANAEVVAGKLLYASRASCTPAGVPMFLIYGAGFQRIYFIQTAAKIVMMNSQNNEIRHIYLNVPHSTHLMPSWYGESVGHYQNDELVVDTIGFNERTLVDDSFHVPHSSQLHVVERFKLIEEGKMLRVNFTIDDPGAFNAPWSGVVTYRRGAAAQPLVEDRCAENNINVLGDRNITPVATKPDF
jgi:hypothetical protein